MPKTIVVAGASGLVGANIVREALSRGYTVRGSMRDSADPAKAPYLMALPGAAERLTLFDAQMNDEGAFDEACEGADGLFIACLIPVYKGFDGTPARELDDARGWAEVINPTVEGCLNILRSGEKAGIRDVVICSST
ncbi:MAG: NAD(P)H-binding protein [Pseudomonadota bacterium]